MEALAPAGCAFLVGCDALNGHLKRILGMLQQLLPDRDRDQHRLLTRSG